ncbi:MAG: Bug family tripartite tricarboxylate transporter substrate binding protein [Xanthobacteraceae bacterium]
MRRLGLCGKAIGLSVVVVAVALASAPVLAQQYPNQDIHFVTGFPPGSGADVITRFFAEKTRVLSGHSVIVENKVGAAGSIATEYVAKSKPDGYTLLINAGSGTAAGMHLSKNPPVDVIKAFQIAGTINRQAFMMVVDAKSPYKTVADVTAAMKVKGDKATYATAAPSGIVMGEMYKAITGVKAVEVRYKDSVGSLNEMLDGKIDYGMHDPVFSLAQQREGRLRILAHSSGKRLNAIPDVPTMAESGVPGMDLTSWWAYIVPAGTPRPVIDTLNGYLKQILETDEAKKFLNQFGGDPFISTPEEGQALFVSDEKAWKEYVRLAKIEPQ